MLNIITLCVCKMLRCTRILNFLLVKLQAQLTHQMKLTICNLLYNVAYRNFRIGKIIMLHMQKYATIKSTITFENELRFKLCHAMIVY